ncbi:MAG: ATP-binding protein [Candidatus Hodarchaeota archaeon]
MIELVIISGKGGTGKTSFTGAFAVLAKNKVLADCDVDAPDLHLLLNPKIKQNKEFLGGRMPIKDDQKCTTCGLCAEHCRFNAIDPETFEINPFECERCGVCARICPEEAITMDEALSGHWFISDTDYGPMVHAELGIGEENSGRLVAVVRQNAKILAEDGNHDLILIDGPPGIGCPVISSVTGVDAALIVTEPTVSGVHDLTRAIDLVHHFNIYAMVCVNKFDLNSEVSDQIEALCQQRNVELIGRIRYDPMVTKALVIGKSIVSVSDIGAARDIKNMWNRVHKRLVRLKA